MGMKSAKERKSFSWKAAEYEYIEKSVTWYAVVLSLVLIFAVFAFATGNFFFGVFVVIAGAMVVMFAKKKPQTFEFFVDESQVRVGKNLFFEYNELESFSVRKRRGYLDEIVIKKKATLNAFVRLPADSGSVEKIREILLEKLPEEEYEESFADIIADRFGF